MKAENRGGFRGRVKLALVGSMLSALAILPAPAAPSAQIQVDVKLVIATDVSHSLDIEEVKLQRQGIADLFLDPEVVRTIRSGPYGKIAVAMAEWSGYRSYRVAVDWTIVDDETSATALAEKILAIPTMLGERTSISNAIERSITLLNDSDNRITATRKVIDVSGDGPNNDGVSLEQVHAATANNGITVNGLPIMDPSSDGYFPDLDQYYAACVVAGKGSFLVVVKSFKDFGDAMRRKLVFEISQNDSQIDQALQGFERPPLLQKIATGDTQPPSRPQVLGPAAFYPDGCDKYGGWRTTGGQ